MSGLKTVIGKYEIPVKSRHATLVHFTGGDGGKHEAGDFAFWTAVLKEPVTVEPKNGWPERRRKVKKIFGRAYVALSAGDRFDRMRVEAKTARTADDRAVYRRMYYECMGAGKNIALVRPTTLLEVRKWMRGHKTDAVFADRMISINGKKVRLK